MNQIKEIERIEKIEVTVTDHNNQKQKLLMNKNLSTPYNCAMRKLFCLNGIVLK